MSIATKKWVSIALTASTVLWAAGVASLPLANAQTTADLQAQIAALLAQIQQLQAQLGSSSSSSTTMASCYPFSSDLTVGSTGAAVTALQQILIAKGYLTAVSAPTGYFGSLTQAAVAKWQAANGITPSAGYFGPKSRAFYASSCVSTTTTTTTTTTGTTTAPATGLAVGLASDSPAAGSLVSGAARTPVLGVDFTAGNSGAVTVTDVKFQKTGVLSDSSVSGAYLIQNGQVIAQYSSLNQGVIDFSGLNWQIPAGQTEDVQLAINISGSSAGNTVGFSLPSATNITAFDVNNNAVTPTGVFPVSGNTFTLTTVSNPSLATISASSTAIGTQVTAGTQDNLVGAWNFSVQNNKVYLDGLNFHVIGSANLGNIQNVKLFVNGTQVGTTLATVNSNGTAYFNLASNPGVLNTGSNNVQVFADVMGSPNMNFQFEILNGFDVYAVDSQYNVPIASNASAGTQVGIMQGQITTTQDANTPTGNIAKGQSQITLAKYDIYAAGEPVRVEFMGFQLAFTGVSTSTSQALSSQIRNIALTDDAGGQVGSTINTPPSGNACDAGYAGTGFTTNSYQGQGTIVGPTVTYDDCFGTSGSPINYTIPANTTRVLSLKADIQSSANFSTVTASLLQESQNLQGVISSALSSSSGATGSALSLAASSVTVGQNTALGGQTVSAGVTNQEIGSYSLTASSAEGLNVNNLTVQASSSDFQNLKVLVNGAQFGTTQGVVNGGTQYTFSGTPFSIPAGSTVNVNVYADTLSSATGLVSPASILTGLSATGQISYSSVGLPSGSVNGQNVTFASGGATVTVAADSSQAPIGQIVMGSTGNPLATFRFTETSNIENVKVTDLKVTDVINSTSTVKPSFSNLTLWNGSTELGSAGSAIAGASSTYVYSFHFSTPVIVPQANSVSLSLKGDAASYASSGATDNSTSTFEIANGSTDVTALGATSNKTATVTGSAVGNPQTVLRSTLTFAATPLGATSGRGKTTSDQLATLSFSANSAGPIALNTITVTFSGSAVTSTLYTAGAVRLLDENNQATCTTIATSSAAGTWSFNCGSAQNGQAVSAGSTRNWTLVVNDNDLNAASTQGYVNLVATINSNSSITFTDGLDNAASTNLSLPSSVLTPIQLNSVVFSQGI